MSLDIYLHDEAGEEVAWMNWLRNPFGLERWIAYNTGVDIWHVVNDHAYDNSENVDRPAFLARVREAAAAVAELEVGYFELEMDWAVAYETTREKIRRGMQGEVRRVVGRLDYYGNFKPRVYARVEMDEYDRFQDRFPDRPWIEDHFTLDRYREWTHELLDFAERLQDPSLTFYCSN